MPRAFFSTKPVETTVSRGQMQIFRGAKAFTDETITPEVSLTVPAVLAAFTILSEDISSLPILLYSQRARNKFRAYDNPYYRLIKDKPNEEHSSMVFREIMMGHLLGWGNFFGQLIFDKNGDVAEIYPLRPDRMQVERKEGERIYTYTPNNGKPRVFFKEEIIHIPAFSFDGVIGYSRIAMMRNAIGLARAAESFGSKFFKNDARPGIALRSKKKMTEDGMKNLRESFTEVYAGQENRWKVAVLEEDMDIATIGLPPEDAQFLQTRSFQLGEIARAFRVPPHMIGDVERSTSWGSGIDSQEQGYVTHTLRPWTTRIEEALNLQLLPPDNNGEFFYEHLFADLLRGDLSTRYEAYVKAINNGIMSPNEARSRENMNPYKGGDRYMVPANMVMQDGSGNTQSDNANTTNALEPLWKDAVARVVKRELNDLNGAVKRLLAKGQTEAFEAWCAKFYGEDHMQFVANQFQPLIEATDRLFGVHVNLADVVSVYLDTQKNNASFLSAKDDVLAMQDALSKNLFRRVLSVIQDEASDEEYFNDY